MDVKKSISFFKNSVTRDSGFSPAFIENMDIVIGYAEEHLTDIKENHVSDSYKIAVDMLINHVEFFIDGYESEMYLVFENEDGDLEGVINNLKRRIEVVEKFKREME